MGVMETTKDIQNQVLETVSAAQDTVVGTVKDLTDRTGGPVVDLSTVPGLDEVPSARDVVDNVFDFAGKVLETSRTFVSGLVDATAPLVQCGAADKPAGKAKKPASPKPKTAQGNQN